MKTFRVYFTDGNQKLYEARHIGEICMEICHDITGKYVIFDVYKIEEVQAS